MWICIGKRAGFGDTVRSSGLATVLLTACLLACDVIHAGALPQTPRCSALVPLGRVAPVPRPAFETRSTESRTRKKRSGLAGVGRQSFSSGALALEASEYRGFERADTGRTERNGLGEKRSAKNRAHIPEYRKLRGRRAEQTHIPEYRKLRRTEQTGGKAEQIRLAEKRSAKNRL